MQTAKEEELDVFRHICKDDLHMDRYAEYGSLSDVVNWGVYEAPMSLADGRRLFPNHTIMGGLANHDGVLTNGSEEEITAEVHRIIQDFGDTGLILGADCTLPTTIPLWRIRAVSSASEGESRM